jgi:hypothetical protein
MHKKRGLTAAADRPPPRTFSSPIVPDRPLGKRRQGSLSAQEAAVLRLALRIDPGLTMPVKALAREIARTQSTMLAARRTLQRIARLELSAPPCGLLGDEYQLIFDRLAHLRLLLQVSDNLYGGAKF